MTDPQNDNLRHLTARVTELEEALTHQQRTVDDLNQVVLQQERRIAAFEATIARLTSELATLSDSAIERRTLEDDRPPHY